MQYLLVSIFAPKKYYFCFTLAKSYTKVCFSRDFKVHNDYLEEFSKFGTVKNSNDNSIPKIQGAPVLQNREFTAI